MMSFYNVTRQQCGLRSRRFFLKLSFTWQLFTIFPCTVGRLNVTFHIAQGVPCRKINTGRARLIRSHSSARFASNEAHHNKEAVCLMSKVAILLFTVLWPILSFTMSFIMSFTILWPFLSFIIQNYDLFKWSWMTKSYTGRERLIRTRLIRCST